MWTQRPTRSSCIWSCAGGLPGRSRRARDGGGDATSAVAFAHRHLADEPLGAGFADWRRDSFRKVCLRAEPAEWEAVRMLDHERVGDVACLPPRRRARRERVLARMQALAERADALPTRSAPPGGR